jgi:hypothetical protein
VAQADAVLGRRTEALSPPGVEREVVVIAAGGDEGSGAEIGLLLEAEDVAIEAEPRFDVPDVEMDVTDAQAIAHPRGRLLAADRAEEGLEVERCRAAARELVLEARPLIELAICGKLDTDPVGVRQIDRLVCAVVRHALNRRARLDQASRGASELLATRIEQRVVVETGMATGRPRLGILVEDDDGLGAVAQLGPPIIATLQPQAERALVPGDRPVEVPDCQMNRAKPKLRGQDPRRCRVPGSHVFMVGVRIEQLAIGADPSRWADAGFVIEDRGARAGEVVLHFTEGEGIRGWRLMGTEGETDGLPVIPRAEIAPRAGHHPNAVTRIDHLVVLTPDLGRTTRALEETGIERRRVREVETADGILRQGFFRLGEVILEVVTHPKIEPGPARFWGITFAVADLDEAAELLGERLGSIRDAVQPGRRIATLRREAGLGLPVALISA